MLKPDFLTITRTLLKGIGQIMLQNNAWTGLFFLFGILLGSWQMGIGVLLAVATGSLTARLLNYDKEEIQSGLYGFSAALVGVAFICFYQPTPVVWIALVFGSALASVLQHLFIVKKIPAFTLPFILVTWLFFVIAHYYPASIQPRPLLPGFHVNDYLSLFSHGFGQVIFQDHLWAGILFFLGIGVSRPIAAVYGLASIALSGMIAFWLNESLNDIYLGLLSFNAVLCAITFAGKRLEDVLKGLISVVLSVLIMMLMRHLHLPALTFPFVLATWLTLLHHHWERTVFRNKAASIQIKQ